MSKHKPTHDTYNSNPCLVAVVNLSEKENPRPYELKAFGDYSVLFSFACAAMSASYGGNIWKHSRSHPGVICLTGLMLKLHGVAAFHGFRALRDPLSHLSEDNASQSS